MPSCLILCSCSLDRRPFVLVDHSYAGISLQSLMKYCCDPSKQDCIDWLHIQFDKTTKSMKNLKGCVFWSVPQKGSMWLAWAGPVKKNVRGYLTVPLFAIPLVVVGITSDRPSRFSMIPLTISVNIVYPWEVSLFQFVNCPVIRPRQFDEFGTMKISLCWATIHPLHCSDATFKIN